MRAAWLLLALALPAGAVRAQTAAAPSPVASVTQTTTGDHNTTIGIVNGQVMISGVDPATVASMVKTFTDQISATAEARAQAEARAAEMGAKLGFTTLAVTEFFRILGEQNVPEDKLTLRLVEIATHFSQTRSEMVALDPEDPGAAELVHQAQMALDAGRLNEAEGLLGRARALEMAAYRQALELRNKAQEAQERHALNGAKLLSSEGRIALTRLHYMQAADDFGQAAALVPASHKDEHGTYVALQAAALYRQGDEYGDNTALRSAITSFHLVLEERRRKQVPLAWART
ncbi:MAG TPA: hypothetical protein VKI44_36300 [Acetobacteraceae bacterium]|nr:hypothetical protein [Acetobacteraceae bacterium]